MKLSDLNKIIFFLIIYFNISSLKSDDTVDIWKKSKSDNEVSESINQNDNEIESSLINKNTITTNSIIQEQISGNKHSLKVNITFDRDLVGRFLQRKNILKPKRHLDGPLGHY